MLREARYTLLSKRDHASPWTPFTALAWLRAQEATAIPA
jgi:hypothetical protein